jgi:hypothetical protein
MTKHFAAEFDGAAFMAEVERYLVAVEAFRAEGREPSWLAEQPFPDLSAAVHRNRSVVNSRGGRK